MFFASQFAIKPRQSMRMRPRCLMHELPSQARPNLFSGD
jgi:hypothetical protein